MVPVTICAPSVQWRCTHIKRNLLLPGSHHHSAKGIHKPSWVTAAALVTGAEQDQDQKLTSATRWQETLALAPLIAPATTVTGCLALQGVIGLPGATTNLLLAATPLVLHGVSPILDTLIGEQPTESQPSTKKRSLDASVLPLMFTLLHTCAMAVAVVTAGSLWAQHNMTQLGLLALSAGMSTAVSFAASHELVHSSLAVDRAAAQLMLCWAMFWPFHRSHPVHHLHVATPEDHTTAHMGEPFWAYMPRYVWGTYRVAWEEEAAEAGRKQRPVFSLANTMLQAMTVQVGMLAASWLVGGVGGLIVHLASATLGCTYLMVMDYMFHYGLTRPKKPTGGYTPVGWQTSFSSGYPVENALLFRVITHADHHMIGSKPYPQLGFSTQDIQSTHRKRGQSSSSADPADNTGDIAPRMMPGVPMGWASLCVFIPPLWFKLADPLAQAANKQHMKANGLAA